jgi:hypothetical protein
VLTRVNVTDFLNNDYPVKKRIFISILETITTLAPKPVGQTTQRQRGLPLLGPQVCKEKEDRGQSRLLLLPQHP